MKTGTTRRSFVGMGLAAIAGACMRLDGNAQPVRFGIISDTHVPGKESIGELARAFAFLRDRNVDAVIHCGDMTDLGYVHQLEAFAEAWRRVMPPTVPLIPVLGNRDMSDTKALPADRRLADRAKLVCSDPMAHVRRCLGLELCGGVRAVTVRGVSVVAADWGHEGELEKFMSNRPELCDPWRPFVHVQHPHPRGAFGGSSQDAAACWLNMFPRAIAVSGHSHRPFSDPKSLHAGEFTFVAAGSHYLSGGPPQKGRREVSVLTVEEDSMHLDRFRLHDGTYDLFDRRFEDKRLPDGTQPPKSFVFATWNIGGFTHGCGGREAAKRAPYAVALRRQVASMDADVIGLAEYRPDFTPGDDSQKVVFGDYRNAVAGPRFGPNCNAIFSRRFTLSGGRHVLYAERKQERYLMSCRMDMDGVGVTVVQTHLDLADKPRRYQIAHLAAAFGKLDRLIIAGDFNVSSVQEFAPLADAGFSMANASKFGHFRTHRRRDTSYTTSIDNVFVKGFDILDAWTDDDSMLLSDHRILLCRLRPKAT